MTWPRAASPAPCASADTLGLDTSQADTSLLAFDYRGWGEVFLARDTVIQSITVWRPAYPETLGWSFKLFITEVDSASEAPRTNRILLSGPSQISYGDGVHPAPYRFLLDPPFALPHRGKFFFAIVSEGGYTSFLAARTDPYTDGAAWSTGPDPDTGRPFGARLENPAWDLIFRIEFCAPGSVGVPASSAPGLSLAAYPNPSSGNLSVSFRVPIAAPASIEVLDLSGRRIQRVAVAAASPGLNTLSLPLKARLRPGLYFVRLDQPPRRLFTKICVVP